MRPAPVATRRRAAGDHTRPRGEHAWLDSNQRPPPSQGGALSTELQAFVKRERATVPGSPSCGSRRRGALRRRRAFTERGVRGSRRTVAQGRASCRSAARISGFESRTGALGGSTSRSSSRPASPLGERVTWWRVAAGGVSPSRATDVLRSRGRRHRCRTGTGTSPASALAAPHRYRHLTIVAAGVSDSAPRAGPSPPSSRPVEVDLAAQRSVVTTGSLDELEEQSPRTRVPAPRRS